MNSDLTSKLNTLLTELTGPVRSRYGLVETELRVRNAMPSSLDVRFERSGLVLRINVTEPNGGDDITYEILCQESELTNYSATSDLSNESVRKIKEFWDQSVKGGDFSKIVILQPSEATQARSMLDQPDPIAGDGDMWLQTIERWSSKSFVSAEVVQLMVDRREFGLAKYKRPVAINNGRNPRVDLVAEMLDALVYSEQCAMMEPDFATYFFGVQRDLLEMIHTILPDDAIAEMRKAFAMPTVKAPELIVESIKSENRLSPEQAKKFAEYIREELDAQRSAPDAHVILGDE